MFHIGLLLSDAIPPTVPNALRRSDSGPHSKLTPRVEASPDRSMPQPRVDVSPSRTRCRNLLFYKIVSGLLILSIYLVFQSAFDPPLIPHQLFVRITYILFMISSSSLICTQIFFNDLLAQLITHLFEFTQLILH